MSQQRARNWCWAVCAGCGSQYEYPRTSPDPGPDATLSHDCYKNGLPDAWRLVVH